MLLGLCVAAAVFVIDQFTKYWVLNYVLETYTVIKVTSFFNIVNAWNTGVSFSMFSGDGYWKMVILCVLASAIVGFLLWWLRNETHRLSQIALGMIIGGAIGNIVDRIRLGAVFDFLDFHWRTHHWPAFNAADAFISIGAVSLILFSFINKKDGE